MRRQSGRWRWWLIGSLLSVTVGASVVLLLAHRRAIAAEETVADPGVNLEYAVVLKSLTFKSDFTPCAWPRAELWDKSDKWADPKDPPDKKYLEPEWNSDHSYPIVHVKHAQMRLKLVFDVTANKPGQLNYHLVGKGDLGWWSFFKDGSWAGPGNDLVIDNVLAAEALPDSVGILKNKQIAWTITINGEKHDLGSTGPHTVYRTFSTPCEGHTTVARLGGTQTTSNSGCCTWAEGTKEPEDIADAIWNNIGDFHTVQQGGVDHDPPYEPSDQPGGVPLQVLNGPQNWPLCWTLLDGEVAGECDEQAALMDFCCRALVLQRHLVHYATA